MSGGAFRRGGSGRGISGRDRTIDGTVHGVFSAATASLALDIGRRPAGNLHGVRLAVLAAAGAMPQVRNGSETEGVRYVSFGLTLTLGLGSEHGQLSPASRADDQVVTRR